MRRFTACDSSERPTLHRPGPFPPGKLSLALSCAMRDNAGMPPNLMALFLLAGASCAVTISTVMYVGFPRPETRFTLVVTLLLVYAVLTLAPWVLLPHSLRH